MMPYLIIGLKAGTYEELFAKWDKGVYAHIINMQEAATHTKHMELKTETVESAKITKHSRFPISTSLT